MRLLIGLLLTLCALPAHAQDARWMRARGHAAILLGIPGNVHVPEIPRDSVPEPVLATADSAVAAWRILARRASPSSAARSKGEDGCPRYYRGDTVFVVVVAIICRPDRNVSLSVRSIGWEAFSVSAGGTFRGWAGSRNGMSSEWGELMDILLCPALPAERPPYACQ